MDTKKLRQKILDLAIHGKLVPQDPNDEPASVLLERIKAEKEQLIKEGKIKRQKKSTSSDKSHYGNDVPFEVPEGWVWCRLGDVLSLISGQDFPPEKYNSLQAGIPYITGASNLVDNEIMVNRWTEYPSVISENGDLLVVCKGAGVGKMAENSIGKAHIARQIQAVRNTLHILLPKYVRIVIEYNIQNIIAQANGLIPGLKRETLLALLIPIPPIEEQKRIVDEVVKWFIQIDAIEQDSSDLKDAVQKAKSKILDLALSGRLTSHTSHYLQLPDGWEYKQLEEVAEIFDNVRIPLNANERENRIRNKQSSELYPYYGATGQVGLVDEYLLEGKFLLLGEDGAPFLDKNAIKAYPVEGRFWVNNHAHILKPKYDFDFLMYYLNGLDYKAYVSGSTRLKLTQSSMSKIKIPMPPKEEQRQISQILNRIFKKLDSIVVDL